MKKIWLVIWNLSEMLNIGLGRFAPWVFGQMIGRSRKRVVRKEHIFGKDQPCQIRKVWFFIEGSIETMQLEFRDGPKYQYFDIPEGLYDELVVSQKPGKFLNERVKGRYRYSAV